MAKVPDPRAHDKGRRIDSDGGRDDGCTLGRALTHVNNFPTHLVIMVFTAPERGKVLCIDHSHEEVSTSGTLVLAEWDLTEQTRKDFE
jgi:hypothetical protein